MKTKTVNIRLKQCMLCSAAVLLIAGCEKNDSAIQNSSNQIEVQAHINGPKKLQNRVGIADGNTFDEGDKIGVFIVDNTVSGELVDNGELRPSGNHADNVLHTLSDDLKWVSGQGDMLWTNNQNSIYLTAYYPYQSNLTTGVTDMAQVPFAVKAKQAETEAGTDRNNYQLSDLLWARSANATKGTATGSAGNTIALKFNHVLSKATINITFNDEFKNAGGTIVVPTHEVIVQGTNINALIDFTKDTIDGGKPNPIGKTIAVANLTTPDYQPITALKTNTLADGATYQAIVVPQTVTNNTLITIKTTANGKVYNYTPARFEFQSGMHHTFNITVGSYNITVTTSTASAINDWGTGAGDTGDADKASIFNSLYWATANLGVNVTDKLGGLWKWDTSLAPAGYKLPSEVEFKAILPSTTGTASAFTTPGYTAATDEQYYSDGTNTIYGIKKDSEGNRYWMRWQYLTAGTNEKYLKITHWEDAVDPSANLENPAGTNETEKLATIKALFPKSQPSTLILPAANSNGNGNYWTATKDRYVHFDKDAINIKDVVSADTEKYSVRCIQK